MYIYIIYTYTYHIIAYHMVSHCIISHNIYKLYHISMCISISSLCVCMCGLYDGM